MLKEMKEEIVGALKAAKESGEVKAEQVREIVKEAVSKTAGSVKEGGLTLREIAKEATTVGIEELRKGGDATKERISAVVDGSVDGIKRVEQEALDTAQQELHQLKGSLREGEERLACRVREAIGGAKESAAAFSGYIKAQIEISVTDAKLKSAEILGLTHETVKQAVKQAI